VRSRVCWIRVARVETLEQDVREIFEAEQNEKLVCLIPVVRLIVNDRSRIGVGLMSTVCLRAIQISKGEMQIKKAHNMIDHRREIEVRSSHAMM
jgi:hypothetical protein